MTDFHSLSVYVSVALSLAMVISTLVRTRQAAESLEPIPVRVRDR